MRLGSKPAKQARCLFDPFPSSSKPTLHRTSFSQPISKPSTSIKYRPLSQSACPNSRHLPNHASTSAPSLRRSAATALAQSAPSLSHDDNDPDSDLLPSTADASSSSSTLSDPIPPRSRRFPPLPHPRQPPDPLEPITPSSFPLEDDFFSIVPKKARLFYDNQIPRVPCRPIPPRPSSSSSSSSAYHPEVVMQPCRGRMWTQQTLIRAYISSTDPFQLSSLDEVRKSVEEEDVGVGSDLPKLIIDLGMDEELFLSWRNVLVSKTVREALEIFRDQNSRRSQSSKDGKPLWPIWLIRDVIHRSNNYADVHLSLALAIHHLPFLPPSRQASLLNLSLSLVIKHDMPTALPFILELCLSSAPDLSEHPSYQNPSYNADIRRFHNGLIRPLLLLRVKSRFDRVNESLVRVLQTMYEREVGIEDDVIDEIFGSDFIGDDGTRDLVFLLMKRQGTEKKRSHVARLVDLARKHEEHGFMRECQTVLREMWIGPAASGEEAQSLSSILEEKRKAFVEGKPEGWAPTTHDPHPVYDRSFELYLRSLAHDPEEAIRCFNQLHSALSPYPSTTPQQGDEQGLDQLGNLMHPLESESSLLISFNWIALVETLGNRHGDFSTETLLRLLLDSRSMTSKRTRGQTYQALMRVFKGKRDYEPILELWEKMIGEGLVPTEGGLDMMIFASKKLDTFGTALRTIDEWLYRPALHQILPDEDGIDGIVQYSQVYVRTLSDPDSPPRLKIRISRDLLKNLVGCFQPRRGRLIPDDFPLNLRIWDAAPSRWGARQDIEAFGRLVQGAGATASDALTRHWPEGWSSALNVMEEGMEANEAKVDWATCGIDQFFMPLPDEESRVPAAWERVRMYFENAVFDNCPELKEAPHPFEELESELSVLHGTGTAPSSFSFPTFPSSSSTSSPSSSAAALPWNPLSPILSSPELTSFLPPITRQYANLPLHHQLFKDYIFLLIHHRLTFDIPQALTWMRHLRIMPDPALICLSIAAVARAERLTPAAVAVNEDGSPDITVPSSSELSEDKKLYVWCRAWLSQEDTPMPTDEEIASEASRLDRQMRFRELWLNDRQRSALAWVKEKDLKSAQQGRIRDRMEGLPTEPFVWKPANVGAMMGVDGDGSARQKALDVLKEREGLLGPQWDAREARNMGLLVPS